MSHCWVPLGHLPAILSWRAVPVTTSRTQRPTATVLPERSTEMLGTANLINKGQFQQARPAVYVPFDRTKVQNPVVCLETTRGFNDAHF